MTERKTSAKTAKKPARKKPAKTVKTSEKPEKQPEPARHFLILMRHGKASKEYDAYEDIDRPLIKRGKKDVKIMRKQLAVSDILPNVILCSSAARTRETCEEMCKAAPGAPAFSAQPLYQASASALLQIVHQIKENVECAMIIGHNPGLAEFSENICDGAYSDDEAFRRMGKKFPTAAIAVFEVTGKWADVKENSAKLIAFIRPADFK